MKPLKFWMSNPAQPRIIKTHCQAVWSNICLSFLYFRFRRSNALHRCRPLRRSAALRCCSYNVVSWIVVLVVASDQVVVLWFSGVVTGIIVSVVAVVLLVMFVVSHVVQRVVEGSVSVVQFVVTVLSWSKKGIVMLIKTVVQHVVPDVEERIVVALSGVVELVMIVGSVMVVANSLKRLPYCN